MSYIVITVWELLIRTIYLYQTPAVFLMLFKVALDETWLMRLPGKEIK